MHEKFHDLHEDDGGLLLLLHGAIYVQHCIQDAKDPLHFQHDDFHAIPQVTFPVQKFIQVELLPFFQEQLTIQYAPLPQELALQQPFIELPIPQLKVELQLKLFPMLRGFLAPHEILPQFLERLRSRLSLFLLLKLQQEG